MERVNALVIDGTWWKSQHTYRSILDGQIELVIEIKASLLAIRQALLTVNANLACVIIFGLIQAASLDLLGDCANYQLKGQVPIFSIATIRRFLSEQLEWISRKGTKDGRKIPKDWEVSYEKNSLDLFTKFAKRISTLLLLWILIRLELPLFPEQIMLLMR